MNRQALVIDTNRVAPAYTEHAIERLPIGADRREIAYELWHTDKCRPRVPSCTSQLTQRIGRSAAHTALVVAGAGVGSIAYVDADFDIMGA